MPSTAVTTARVSAPRGAEVSFATVADGVVEAEFVCGQYVYERKRSERMNENVNAKNDIENVEKNENLQYQRQKSSFIQEKSFSFFM